MEMRRGVGAMRHAAALGALLSAVAAAELAGAQERESAEADGRECRCMDAQGSELERCICFVLPDEERLEAMGGRLERMAERIAALPFGRRALLGVRVRADQPAEYDAQGARLYEVDRDGAAAREGLGEGDVLVSVDGRSLLEPLPDPDAEAELDEERSLPVQRLLALLEEREPGDEVTLEYRRDGARRSATVALGGPRFGALALSFRHPLAVKLPPGARAGPPPRQMLALGLRAGDCPAVSPDGREPHRALLPAFGRNCAAGAELVELNEGLAEYFEAEAGDVLVTEVSPDHPFGLEPGDVLLAIDGREVRGLDHALRMLRSYERGEPIRVRVLRRGETREVEGTLG